MVVLKIFKFETQLVHIVQVLHWQLTAVRAKWYGSKNNKTGRTRAQLFSV